METLQNWEISALLAFGQQTALFKNHCFMRDIAEVVDLCLLDTKQFDD